MCLDIFIMFFLVVPGESTTNCIGKCCEGYRWDVNREKCEKCKPGYIGPSCSIKCPHPAYGDACQGICNCSKDECDFVTGCKPMSSVVGDHTTQDMDPSSVIYNTTVFSYQAPSSAPSRSDYATGETLNSSGSDSDI
ncbi:uncharacterized protein LOC144620185 isoform X2 [Crassostrea virginica]